jgi:hypothetical protein
MYLRYPVRNFKCPFCGAKMPTEQYRFMQPWVCPGCSQELQFSKARGCVLQFCFFGAALLCLYWLGLRGWQLVAGAVLGGSFLTVALSGPLDRVIPHRLEPYDLWHWKEDKVTTIFPAGRIESGEREQPARHPDGSRTKDSQPRDDGGDA